MSKPQNQGNHKHSESKNQRNHNRKPPFGGLWHITIGRRALQVIVCRFLIGGDRIEVKINKEVREYNESLFFGLTLRQCLFALLAIVVAVAAYFLLRGVVGEGQIGVVCILAAFPFALGGFFRYNGMTFEQFITAFIQSELLYPKRLISKSDNLYAKAMEHSTIKEALRLD